jgi:hypothetical protein
MKKLTIYANKSVLLKKEVTGQKHYLNYMAKSGLKKASL